MWVDIQKERIRYTEDNKDVVELIEPFRMKGMIEEWEQAKENGLVLQIKSVRSSFKKKFGIDIDSNEAEEAVKKFDDSGVDVSDIKEAENDLKKYGVTIKNLDKHAKGEKLVGNQRTR